MNVEADVVTLRRVYRGQGPGGKEKDDKETRGEPITIPKES